MRIQVNLRARSRSIVVAVMAGVMLMGFGSSASAAPSLTPIGSPILGGTEALLAGLGVAGGNAIYMLTSPFQGDD